jgi:peptidyl-prolyl cis-trans isomerase D
MLNFLRDSLKTGAWPKLILAAVGIGLVAYLGAYWTGDSQQGGGGNWAATVNGEEISIRRFQIAARNVDTNYREMLGESYEQFIGQMQVGTQAIQRLIEQELILQDADRMGLRISDDELVERIREAATDPATGEFMGRERYVELVTRNIPGGVEAFEKEIRDQLLMDKWTDMMTQTVDVEDAELEERFRQQTVRTAINFVMVPASEQEYDTDLSDDEVRAWYESHADDYMRDEGRQIRFVTIERDALLEGIELTEEELRASYEENQASYSHPEQRRASHILFRMQPDASDEEKARLRGVAESVLGRARNGEEFAGLAQAYSQDPVSAARGGDLGFFGRGEMVPPFDAAAFDTPVGQLAEGVVESNFGFHVILVTDARDVGVMPFEEVKEEIRQTLRLRRAQELVASEAQRLRGELTDASMLEQVAQANGLELQSRFVERGERLSDIGASPEFVESVFQIEPGTVSPPLGTARGMSLLVVDAIVPPSVAPLEDVANSVRTDLLNERARQTALRNAQRAMRPGTDIDAVAGALGRQVAASGDMAPGQAPPGTGGSTDELQQALFGAGVMIGDRGVVEVPAGALVYEVTGRQEFDSYAFEDSKPALRAEMLRQRRFALRQALVNQMIQTQEVAINGELIAAYNNPNG